MKMSNHHEPNLFQRSVESLTVLSGFSDHGIRNRDDCYFNTKKLLFSWYMGFGSPKECSFLENSTENGDAINGDTSMYHLIEEQIPDILRLQATAPLEDVREKCEMLLRDLQEKGFKIPRKTYEGPSSFIPLIEMEYLNRMENMDLSSPEVVLFQEHFHEWCRLENYMMVMGFHPDYMENFMKLQHYLLRDDCPLPYADRYYICLCAAARHKCVYLIYIYASEFLASGGDPNWLRGLEYAPRKLRDLAELNKLLAHRPWLITKDHIAQLVRGNGRDTFSLSELMHAIALITHVHSLASLVFGCGVQPEVDHPGGHTYRNPSSERPGTPGAGVAPHTPTSLEAAGGYHNLFNGDSSNGSPVGSETYECPVDELMERMVKVKEEEVKELELEELAKRFQSVEYQNAQIQAIATGDFHSPFPEVVRFVEDPSFGYVAFTSADYSPFRIQDYTWEDDACTLADHLSADLGTLFDEKFKVALNLTYHTMGNQQNVDTRPYRIAIWNYIHSLFGVRHDDYNYTGINQLMQRPLKTYLKLAAASPHVIRKKHYVDFMPEFRHSEKVHVNVMVLEARLQATLLYALRAINKHMTRH